MTTAMTTAMTMTRSASEADHDTRRARGTARGWARGWLRAGAWLLLLAATAAVLVGVLVPRLVGATAYTVMSGSMSPTYPAGTLVVVRPTDVEDVELGDVLTFETGTETSEVVTHRVVGVGRDESGERQFVVKGDANATPDALAVEAGQVRGTVWYGVPWLGRANVWLTGRVREVVVDLAAAGLVGFGALTLLSGVRDRRRSREGRDA